MTQLFMFHLVCSTEKNTPNQNTNKKKKDINHKTK